MTSPVHRVHLSRAAPQGRRWAVPCDAVLTVSADAADGPPPPVAGTGLPTAAELTAWLTGWAPVELVLDEPWTVLDVASPALRVALAQLLPARGAAGAVLAVCYGAHRFDLTDPLDRSLWRLLSARWTIRS